MSWDSKARGDPRGYFYISIRQGDKVRKTYLGKGAKAKEMARQLEARRRHQEAQREAILLEEAQVAGAERGLLELQTLINELVHAAFKSAGYHKHRGEYRRKRNGRDSHSRSDS